MKLFITGGSGFIGTAVVREAKRRKHRVLLLKGRLNDRRAIEVSLARFKPDAVIHLAWEGIPDLGKRLSAKNKREGIAFFKLLARMKVPKVVVTGSCWQHAREGKYGDHRDFVEAKNKLQKEGRTIIEKSGGSFIWTFPYYVYGPGKRSGALIPALMNDAKKGIAPVAKQPDAYHDFVYVDDVARALVLLAEKSVHGGAYDIGSGSLTRTGDIANAIARAFKLPVQKLKGAKKTGLRANTRTLTRATGWRARVSIDAGLQATM